MLALFAAIGMVGVVGATSMGVMKGPVRGMHNVTQKTIAENNMIASGKLAVMAASNQAASGDCDADNTVEPLPWVATAGAKPAGGGLLPSSIGASLQDPWGNTYGYCAWDHGAAIQTTCATPTLRLAGTNVPAANAKPVIAIVSSGPDRIFQTTCINHHATNPYVSKTVGSDDIILAYSYAEAQSLSAGLWNLQTTDLNTAEIKKNLEVKNASNAVVFGVDSTTDISKPSIKVDYIKSLSQPQVEMLSPLEISGTGANESLDLTGNAIVRGRSLYFSHDAAANTNNEYMTLFDVPNDHVAAGSDGVLSLYGDTARGRAWNLPTVSLAAHSGYFTSRVGIGVEQPTQSLDVNGTMAATIMYDKNDGGYYVDPNSTSRMNALHPNTISCMNGTCPPGGVARFTPNLHLNSGDGNAVIVNWDNGTTGTGQSLRVGNGASADAFYVRADGLVYAAQYRDINDGSYYIDPASTSLTNDFRANIFYDRQDTNYYADPNATSMFNDLRANIFYDRQDTSYYVDPNSISMLRNLRMDHSGSYDIWIQGGTATSGQARNLAFLGVLSSDQLYINHSEEYTGGTVIGGPVTNTTNTSSPIYYDQNDGNWYTDPNNTSRMNNIHANIMYDVHNTGYYVQPRATSSFNAVYANGYYYHSDLRLKDNIRIVPEDRLGNLYKLNGVTFNWKESGEADIGLIAQEVEKYFPEMVSTNAEGVKGVKYGNIVALLLEAVKTQKAEIDALKEAVNLPVENIKRDNSAGTPGREFVPDPSMNKAEGQRPIVRSTVPLIDLASVAMVEDLSKCKKPEKPVCLGGDITDANKPSCQDSMFRYIFDARIHNLCVRGDSELSASFAKEYEDVIAEAEQKGLKQNDAVLGEVMQTHVAAFDGLRSAAALIEIPEIDLSEENLNVSEEQEQMIDPAVSGATEGTSSTATTGETKEVVPTESTPVSTAVESLPSWVLPVVIGNGLLTLLLVMVFVGHVHRTGKKN